MQRKLRGVDRAGGDQRFRAGDHDPGVGLVADGGGSAGVHGGKHRIRRGFGEVPRQSRVQPVPFLVGDKLADRLSDEVMSEVQLGAG